MEIATRLQGSRINSDIAPISPALPIILIIGMGGARGSIS